MLLIVSLGHVADDVVNLNFKMRFEDDVTRCVLFVLFGTQNEQIVAFNIGVFQEALMLMMWERRG